MPTTYTNGLKLPDLGSIDWYNAYKNNIDILDPIVGTVNGVATTYAPISHSHDASEITSGTIDIARLPPAALERLTTVADQTARYALTTNTVQLGDTVKQLDTGIMYLVVDTTKLNSADGYVEYSAGTASKAIADEDGTSIKTGYGKLAGNQTWTGTNSFHNLNPETNSTYSLGTSSLKWSNIYGDNFYSTNYYTIVTYTRNASDQPTVTAFIREFKVDSADGKSFSRYATTVDKTYTNMQLIATMYDSNGDVDNEMRVRMQVSASEKIFIPGTNGDVKLGTSSNRWSSVYADSYYYGTTAWGLDKSNVWTQTNRYTGYIESQYTQSGGYSDIRWVNELDEINACFRNYADNLTLGKRYTGKTAWYNGAQFSLLSNGLAVIKGYDGTNYSSVVLSGNALYPDTSINLGISSKKWKTLNGVNPGALSLPDSANAILTIDTTGWTLNNPVQANVVYINNSNKAPCDGWLYVNIKDATNESAFLYNYTRDYGVTLASNGSQNGLPGRCAGFLPVLKGDVMRVYLNTTNLTDIKFFPCLGNV